MARADIHADIPEEEMTLEQLTFRRNGYLHDIRDIHHRGISNNREIHKSGMDAQAALARVEALIAQKIAEQQAAEAAKNG